MNDALFRPSSMLRRQRCPGSLALESTLPESADDPTEYQAEGSKLHALIADRSLPRDGCTPSQMDLLSAVEDAERGFLATIAPSTAGFTDIIEKDFGFHWNGKLLFAGHPDSVRIFLKPSVAVILERKMGFKKVTTADANLQLRCYITLVAEQYPSANYYGVLMQPRVSSKPQIVHYTRDDVEKARHEIKAHWDSNHAPDAPRRPSPEGCEHCLAQAVCPEFQSWAFAIEKAAHLPSAQWSDETWNEFLVKRPIVEKFLKERLDDAKLIKAANPERLPEWKLRDGAEVRHVTDIVKAWASLEFLLTQAVGKDAAAKFSACCSLAIGDLEDLLWSLRKDDPKTKISQKEAKRMVNQLLSDVIEKKRNKPSLVKDE